MQLEWTALEPGLSADWPAGLTVEGIWQIESGDALFGGFSALLLEAGEARAFSDLGEELRFTLPGRQPTRSARMTALSPPARLAWSRSDIEAAVRDGERGHIWLAYEQVHALRRLDPVTGEIRSLHLRAMREWPGNSGAEAMVRLADGRFLLLGERNARGLIFPGDPLNRKPPLRFTIAWPPGWHPVDAVLVPDGRVLVLMRRLIRSGGWPPFRSMLMTADPREIAGDATWRPHTLVRLNPALPFENYEALALEPNDKSDADGGDTLTIWLMSDDNMSIFQCTLLARLRWQRGAIRRP